MVQADNEQCDPAGSIDDNQYNQYMSGCSGLQYNGEDCKYCDAGDCTEQTVPAPKCGDGVVQTDNEECDYAGGDNEYDRSSCTAGYGEVCEYCSSDCEIQTQEGPKCGDGVVTDNEECDPAGSIADNPYNRYASGCSDLQYNGEDCKYCDAGNCTEQTVSAPKCGDGEKNGDEVCDDPDSYQECVASAIPDVSCLYCKADCSGYAGYNPPVSAVCGDGQVSGGEQCDPEGLLIDNPYNQHESDCDGSRDCKYCDDINCTKVSVHYFFGYPIKSQCNYNGVCESKYNENAFTCSDCSRGWFLWRF